MIKEKFGFLKFSQLTAIEIETRFNALEGSNTRPRAMFNLTDVDINLQKLAEHNIYFGGLHSFEEASEGIQSMLSQQARPGALVWNTDIDAEKIFIKCKD